MTHSEVPERFRCSKVYSLEEIKKHDQPDDLWMVFYNKVYDVTQFAPEHPGGVEVLYDCGGVDGTEAFEDVGHSDVALKMLTPYLMGQLHADDSKSYAGVRLSTPEVQVKENKRKGMKKQRAARRKLLETLSVVLLLALLAVSLLLYWTVQKFKWAQVGVLGLSAL